MRANKARLGVLMMNCLPQPCSPLLPDACRSTVQPQEKHGLDGVQGPFYPRRVRTMNRISLWRSCAPMREQQMAQSSKSFMRTKQHMRFFRISIWWIWDMLLQKCSQKANCAIKLTVLDQFSQIRVGQQKQRNVRDHSDFLIDWQAKQVVCPAGQISRDWGHIPDRHGKLSLRVRFPLPACRACALHERCTQTAAKVLILRPDEQTSTALRKARKRQATPECADIVRKTSRNRRHCCASRAHV